VGEGEGEDEDEDEDEERMSAWLLYKWFRDLRIQFVPVAAW
jgi:hypothetical protein